MECKQGCRSVLSTNNNFSRECEEIRLVEMHDDVIAPGTSCSMDKNGFLRIKGRKRGTC